MDTARKHFQKIAVIGAGTMGSGIAAQIANAGLNVTLIDLAAKEENAIPPAELAIKRLIKSDPPQLFSKLVSNQIETGTVVKIQGDKVLWKTNKSGAYLIGDINKLEKIENG